MPEPAYRASFNYDTDPKKLLRFCVARDGYILNVLCSDYTPEMQLHTLHLRKEEVQRLLNQLRFVMLGEITEDGCYPQLCDRGFVHWRTLPTPHLLIVSNDASEKLCCNAEDLARDLQYLIGNNPFLSEQERKEQLERLSQEASRD